MPGRQAAWWLAALGLHALVWVLLHPIISTRNPAPDATPPVPLRISEVTVLAQSASPVSPARATLAPASAAPPPSASRPQVRQTVSAASSIPASSTSGSTASASSNSAPAGSGPMAAAPEAPPPALPPLEPPTTVRESAGSALAPPGQNASMAIDTPSAAGRAESGLASREEKPSAGSRPVGSVSGAIDRTQGPRVDASWQGNVPPAYPLAARRRREEGTVRLDLLVEADGTVSQVRLRQSSGSATLDRSVMQTVRHWRFVPARQDGQAIAAWYSAWEWVFRLEGGS